MCCCWAARCQESLQRCGAETWFELASSGQFDGQGDHHTPRPRVRQTFRKHLECGIFAHGFARAWCDDCGHDYFVAYFCKGRGVCPSCNTRRMVETGNESYRFRHSTMAAKTRIKARESERKGGKTVPTVQEDGEPF